LICFCIYCSLFIPGKRFDEYSYRFIFQDHLVQTLKLSNSAAVVDMVAMEEVTVGMAEVTVGMAEVMEVMVGMVATVIHHTDTVAMAAMAAIATMATVLLMVMADTVTVIHHTDTVATAATHPMVITDNNNSIELSSVE
jgi:hypothetical protein